MGMMDEKLVQAANQSNLLNELNNLFFINDDLEVLLNSCLSKVCLYFQADSGLILLRNDHSEPISCLYNCSQERIKKARQQLKNIDVKIPLVQKDNDRNILYLPLSLNENFLGIMILYFENKNTIQNWERVFLIELSQNLAQLFNKANSIKDMKKSMLQFSVLYSIAHNMSGKLTQEEILEKTLPYLAQMFEAKKAWIILLQEDNWVVVPPYIGLNQNEISFLGELTQKQLEVSKAVLNTGQLMHLDNPFQTSYFSNRLDLKDGKVLLIPLKLQNVPLGVIYLAHSNKGKFTLVDSQLAISVSNQLAGAMVSVKLHEKLTQENLELETAYWLKSQFLANISHELRTPMNSIIGYTHCLLDGIDGEINDEQRKDLEKVLASAENLLGLINDVLDLSKIEAGRMDVRLEPTDLVECLESTLFTLERLANKKGLQVIRLYSKLLPLVRGDSSRIKQILLNLLSNATKFTEEGTIKINVTVKDDYLEVEIEDTGIGISEQDRLTIFEEFRQVDGSSTRRYGGTGLGLAITKRLVELQKGQIWVESHPGKGSKFTFTLPRERTE